MNTPIYRGLAQSDLDMNHFNLLNWSGGGGGGVARKFDVKTYGAIGDGTTDDTTAIQAALAAIPAAGGVLYFPAGRYKYAGATLTLDRLITVEGDGGNVQFVQLGPPVTATNGGLAITTIDFNSATGTLFTVTAHGCTFKNLGLRNTSSTTPSAGAGIAVTAGGDRTLFENMTVDGFYINIDVQAGSAPVWENCFIVAPVLYGIKLRNILVPDGGDDFVSNCYFLAGGTSRTPTAAIRVESGGGLKVVNTKINTCPSPATPWVNGIDLAVVDGISTSDLLVSNCSIEFYSGTGIKGAIGTSQWANILITGNQFNPSVSSSQPAVGLSAASSGGFYGITIVGNYALNWSGTSVAAYSVTNCTNVIFMGNGQQGYSSLFLNTGSTFADSPVYVGSDARLVSLSGGVKLEVRNTSSNTWVEATRYTNP
jgi:hypothetical protein